MIYDNITSKEELLLDTISKYFYNNKEINSILPIITGESNISLRSIDWFVTNYSQLHNVTYKIKKKNNLINFNVYSCYKNQLKAFNKRYFDPFCRINKNNNMKRILFKYNENNYIQTTIGQINFFKWAIENDIIKYINDNYENIYYDMNNKSSKLFKKIDNKNFNFKLIL